MPLRELHWRGRTTDKDTMTDPRLYNRLRIVEKHLDLALDQIKEENFNITGAAVNAPLVKNIISRMIEILKIPRFNASEILNAAIRIKYQRYYVT